MNAKNSEISITRFIHSDTETLFDYWLEPEKIKTWIFPASTDTIDTIKTDPKVGGAFSFIILRNGEKIEHLGEYLEIDNPKKLVFTWAVADEEGSDRVELELTPAGSGSVTKITLTTELHPDWVEYAAPTKKAWGSMLDSLKKAAEPLPAAKAEMLIRKSVSEVFEAFVNPAITSKFWFTKASGKMEEGKQVEWTWEMYNVSGFVNVIRVEKNKHILIEWDEPPTSVEWIFTPLPNGTTYVNIANRGFSGSTDDIVSQALDSKGGFTIVLAGLKALLEHGIELNLVRDQFPEGLP